MGRAEDLPTARRVVAFLTLMIFEFFYGWCFNTVDVLRPQIRAALGVSLTEVGAGYTAQSLGALVGAVVMGQLADHFGKRRMLLIVILGYGGMAALGALVTSYAAYLLQRFCLGFFLGAIFPVLIGLYMGLFASTLRGKLASLGNGTYNLSVVALGYAFSMPFLAGDWRRIILAGALPPLLFSPLLLLLVPDDRKVRAWGADAAPPPLARWPVSELFSATLRRRTGLLFLLVGLNFFAYQAFAGWVTTFLREARGIDAALTGRIVAAQFIGATLGGFFWGWFSDRHGRKVASLGFFAGAAAVLVYLLALHTPEQFRWTGAIWGFSIASSVAWAPWMSELFPAHLRSTAMSIFNWGRLISMTSPLVTGAVAERLGLRYAMLLAAIGFALAGVVWLLLPETLQRRPLATARPFNRHARRAGAGGDAAPATHPRSAPAVAD